MYIHVSRYKQYTRVQIRKKILVNGIRKTLHVEQIGSARDDTELALLRTRASQRLVELRVQLSLLDALMEQQTTGTGRMTLSRPFAYGLWQILGGIYDQVGLPTDEMLKHLVLARIALPKSKLATVRYCNNNLRLDTSLSAVYRFMDTLNKNSLTATLLDYAQKRALARSNGATAISVVFYDVTTLYFETDEDDEDTETATGLRKKGYSKDHRYDLPQVVVGLTVDNYGFPLDFQVYEGNTYEGRTLLAGVQAIQTKLNLTTTNLTVVADAGMLSQANLTELESQHYSYIVGARIRSLPAMATEQILAWDYTKQGGLDTTIAGRRMVVTYSDKRAKRSKHNRERLIKKLQAKLDRGDVVTKSKYVVLEAVEIGAAATAKTKTKPPKLVGHLDTDRLKWDARFDGLKGYVTNTDLSGHEVIAHYGNLWKVEKSFRMSKSDLRARPTFHYKRKRVIAHLTLCVCALGVLRVFEEQLQTKIPHLGISEALEELLAIQEYKIQLPGNKVATIYSELTEVQEKLLRL